MIARPCPDCLSRGILNPTARADGRCPQHRRQAGRRTPIYSDPRYLELRSKVLAAWRGEHGDVCPGYRVPAHPAVDLQLDHVLAISLGGAPFERSNAAVLCKACNTAKGGANRKRNDRTTSTGGTHRRLVDPAGASSGASRTPASFQKTVRD